MIIYVGDLLDVPHLQESAPGFKSVTDEQRNQIVSGMEVRVRRGEYFRVRIDSIAGTALIGTVITETFSLEQPFEYMDQIQFEKKNVIDIYDIDRWGVLI